MTRTCLFLASKIIIRSKEQQAVTLFPAIPQIKFITNFTYIHQKKLHNKKKLHMPYGHVSGRRTWKMISIIISGNFGLETKHFSQRILHGLKETTNRKLYATANFCNFSQGIVGTIRSINLVTCLDKPPCIHVVFLNERAFR